MEVRPVLSGAAEGGLSMAELKPFEVIVKIDFGASDGVVAVAHAQKVSKLVRCGECRYSRQPNRYDKFEKAACDGVLICCVGFDHVYPSSDDGLIFVAEDFFCADGERLETPNIPTEIINSVLGEDE